MGGKLAVRLAAVIMEYVLKNSSFLFNCKQNYFLGIKPGEESSKQTEGYQALRALVCAYMEAGLIQEFSEYLAPGPYLSHLWAAHLILELNRVPAQLRSRCLEVIRWEATEQDTSLVSK